MSGADLVILVPVLNRPQNVAPLLDSIEAATPGARVLFLTDPGDMEELAAIKCESSRRGLCVEWDIGGGSWATKINRGVQRTAESYLFTGADDLYFAPGWFEAAKSYMVAGVGCVGTQDLCNPRVIRGEHATHFLLARWFAEEPCIDGSPGPIFEGYMHWGCDDELLGTATKRGAYAFANDAVVEHHHPMNGKAPDDTTYQKGQQSARRDLALRNQRRRLWA